MGKMELDLNAYFMPFTPNRQFKSAPRLVVGAKDMYYTTDDGRQLLDGTSGLWCVSAGHRRQPIVDAVKQQLDELDYVAAFQMAHPKVFMAAERIAEHMPDGLDHVFFTNSGSEAVDTALKMALAYWRAKGQGHRTVLVGRETAWASAGFRSAAFRRIAKCLGACCRASIICGTRSSPSIMRLPRVSRRGVRIWPTS
jgi:beta-alanine--pyruvate transaminase